MLFEELTALVEAFPDPVIVVDSALTIVCLNSGAAAWFPSTVAGACAIQRSDWLTRGGTEALAQVQHDDGPGREAFEVELAHPGESRWVEARCKKLALSGGDVWVLSLRDRTAQRRERRRREVALGRMEQAILSRSIGIYEHDHRTDQIYGSKAVRDHYGLDETQPLSIEVFAGATHPDDAEFLVAEIARAHDPGGDGVFDVRHRILTPSGETRWLDTRAQTRFRRTDGGETVLDRTLGSSIDITREHATELAMRRLAAILDATPDVVATTDLGGTLDYLNHAGRDLAGMARQEPLGGRSISSLIPPRWRQVFDEQVVPTAIREGVWSGELELRRRDGAPIPVSLVVLAHRQTRSIGAYLSIIAHDQSQQRQLEEQLRHSQKLEAVGQLAGGIAHDFNNLLSVILGFATLVREDCDVTDGSKRYAGEVLRAAERAAELTRQLLSFSRRQVMRPRVFGINEVLRAMEPMVRRLVGETIDVTLSFADEPSRMVADPSQMEQVLLNLVVNARDAMPGGGKLAIEAALAYLDDAYAETHVDVEPGAHVVIAISDTGVGMSRKTQARIFEPFFTTKPPGQGTGLGLSTAFGIVRQSGGTLGVFSEEGRGTTFKLIFPATDAPPEELVRASRQPRRGGAGEVVLVVEDEPQLRGMVATILAEAGYRPLVSTGPLEALEMARNRKHGIALVLADVVMPQMSGKQLADCLAESGSTVPVLYMSGYAESVIVHHGVLDEGIHFLPKPFTPVELLVSVARAMGTRS